MDLPETLRKLRRPKKIAVCTAWGSPFSWSHADYNLMNLNRPEGIPVKFLPGMGRDPGRRHMWGVEKALEWGASHICFLGADQMHDVDILEKFVVHIENGWSAVTAMVPVRGWVPVKGVNKPFQKFAWAWKDDKRVAKFDQNYLKLVTPEDGPYMEIVCVGSGAIIFDASLLGNLQKPWFKEAEADENARRPAAMDTGFVWRLVVEAGARILCDTTINVVHLDVFPIDDSFGDRFADWPNNNQKKVICDEGVCRDMQ